MLGSWGLDNFDLSTGLLVAVQTEGMLETVSLQKCSMSVKSRMYTV